MIKNAHASPWVLITYINEDGSLLVVLIIIFENYIAISLLHAYRCTVERINMTYSYI